MNPRQILVAGRLLLAEELTATVRHRLNNHFSAVRNASFYLRQRVEKSTTLTAEDARVGVFFELIDRELVAASALMAGLHSGARAVDGGTVRASGLAEALWPLVSPEGPCQLRVELDEPIHVDDPTGCAAALLCLLENAVEALGRAGGAVTLSSRRAEGATVIEVCNDGPGFTPGALERAAEPFFTTRENHLGLGLSVASRVAERGRGRLELAPGQPSGAVARLRFPEARS